MCYVGKVTTSFGIVSDDRKHDSVFALAAMELISDECMKPTAGGKNDITIII